MLSGPADQAAAIAAGRGHLRASHADREQMIDSLKAAYVQGRLTKDEFDARVGQTLASRTYAELAMVTAGIPAGPAVPRPPRTAPRPRMGNAARWGASGLVVPAIVAAAFALGGLAFVVAFVYFVFWLSAGAEMLWQWFSVALPSARPCVRCAHTVASHRRAASCAVRGGSLKRCSCVGYVPPGLSPKAADLRLLSAR